ncbi:hypothetical protein [Thiohalocapsa marina]|nr:hypothetical protein [Thiohalocapsa marina]
MQESSFTSAAVDPPPPETRPRGTLGGRFLGGLFLTFSLGLVSCQSLFFR